jgi:hypothetical protein
MADIARPIETASDFPGIMTNVDPRDIPAGAAEIQFNLSSIFIGELTSRLGIREVVFEDT